MIVISLVFIILIILVVLIVVYTCKKTKTQCKRVPGKTIWLLWMQGWDENTPWVVQQVRKSWELLNPGWNIELVSEHNLSDYVKIPYINHPDIDHPAKSDIIRLKLLSEHGGVWADATLLCMIPLDRWIYDAIEPSGFWMYHGRDNGKGPASWFIVSLKQSIIASKWYNSADNFWKDKLKQKGKIQYDYFWMDDLFKKLYENDRVFLREWKKVPYLWCEDKGQSHMLAEKVFNDNEDLKDILKNTPPYVLKLTRRGYNEKDPNHEKTNGYAAIQAALKQELAPYPLHEMKQLYPSHNKFSKIVAVTEDFNQDNSINKLYKMCNSKNIQLFVYDKTNFCKHIHKYIYSRPLQNEGNSFLNFIIKYYDNLPNDIIYIYKNRLEPLDLTKKSNCKNSPIPPEYKNTWIEKYSKEIGMDFCKGIIKTNKDNISKHSKQFYIDILNSIEVR